MDDKMDLFHEEWMRDWEMPTRAENILVFHGMQSLTAFGDKGFKYLGKIIRTRGYDVLTWHIEATKCGTSMWSNYVVTLCFPKGCNISLSAKLEDDISLRPCRKLIRTYEVHPSKYHPPSSLIPSLHPYHSNLVGTLHGHAIYDWDGPCCGTDVNSWIKIPNFGIRHLL